MPRIVASAAVVAGVLVVTPLALQSASAIWVQSNTVAIGHTPTAIVVDPVTQIAYVAEIGNDSVAVVDENTGAILTTFATAGAGYGIALDQATHTLWVPNVNHDTVQALDESTGLAITSFPNPIPVTTIPMGATVNQSTNTVYVASQGDPLAGVDGTVAVINGTTGAVITTITFPAGSALGEITADPTMNLVYVTDQNSNTVFIISGASNTIVGSVTAGIGHPVGIGVDTSTHVVYVSNNSTNTVSSFDGITGAVVGAPIAVGNGLFQLAVDSVTHTAYVTSAFNDTVAVIDATTRTVSTPATGVGSLPAVVGIDAATHVVFVGNQADNTVSILRNSPSFVTTALAAATVRTAYSFAVVANGTAALTFSLASGTLPPGLSINATTGVISGTPTLAGTFAFAVTATNGTAPAVTQPLTLVVAAARPALAATGADAGPGLAGGSCAILLGLCLLVVARIRRPRRSSVS